MIEMVSNKKVSKLGVLYKKGALSTFREKTTYTYPNIWCIFLEEQSHGPLISFTSSTELKSSFPL